MDQTPVSALIEARCSSVSRVTLADKAALYAQGEPAAALFVVMDGFVKTSHLCEDGTEIAMDLLKRDDIAGAFPDPRSPQEYEETARAIGTVAVQRVPASELRAGMAADPRLALLIAEHLAQAKRSAERRMLSAMTKSVDRRVIERLVELAGIFGARCPHGFSLEIRLTQQDIADFVGASRPVVSAILGGLRLRGFLDYTRDMICVNDSALSLAAGASDGGAKAVSSS
jgi:CRP/FNR family transcriptional regulator, cyclic AMP receptor protein